MTFHQAGQPTQWSSQKGVYSFVQASHGFPTPGISYTTTTPNDTTDPYILMQQLSQASLGGCDTQHDICNGRAYMHILTSLKDHSQANATVTVTNHIFSRTILWCV
uniref:Uncharacterized protein n=1 Tax=Bionectria ochroleuca TaxID=29856 RepID=A0A8H7ND16_BIOOC